LGFSLTGFYAE